MEKALKDERFSHIFSDPRFCKIPKNVKKVAVDKRFKEMFDENFDGKSTFDKRGRPFDFKPSENLKELYDLCSESSEIEDDDESENESNEKTYDAKRVNKLVEEKKPLSESQSSEDEENESNHKNREIGKKRNFVKQFPDKQSIKKDNKTERNQKQKEKSMNKNTEKKKSPMKKLPEKQSIEDDENERNHKKKQKVKKLIKNAEKKSSKKPIPKNFSYEEEKSSEHEEWEEKKSSMKKVPQKHFIQDDCKNGKFKIKQKTQKLSENAEKKKSSMKLFHEKCAEQEESSEDDPEEELSEEEIDAESPVDRIPDKHSLKRYKELVSDSDDSDFDSNDLPENKMHKKSLSQKHFNLKKQENESSKKISLKSNLNKKDSSEDSDASDDSESDDNTGDQSSSDDSDDSESDDQSKDFDHQWEELRNEAADSDEITRRIAVCNMDWDRIRAEDLFVCFNSFKPADGCVNSVKIYPSEFGLKRMEEEKMHGPPELVEETLPSDAEEPDESKKQSRFHREKLRQYQIMRLKYYYAVIDCDSPETANVLYDQLNGMEYESSSVRFDLRFIPDDITFDHEPVSVVDKLPNVFEYKPRLFVNSALQQVKVNLTWDETDTKRREILQKAFTEPESVEEDIKAYLASSSDESEEEEKEEEMHCDNGTNNKPKFKERLAKYKELLFSIAEKEKEEEEEKNNFHMQISWEPGLKEKTKEIVKDKIKKDSLNPFEEMLQKRKDERKSKKREQKAMQQQAEVDSEPSDSDGEFFSKSLSDRKEPEEKSKDIKKLAELALISDSKEVTNFGVKAGKKKMKEKAEEVDNILDLNDPRFSAIHSSHLFNIYSNKQDDKVNQDLLRIKQQKHKSTEFHEKSRNPKKARHS